MNIENNIREIEISEWLLVWLLAFGNWNLFGA
jgi:hypothetical protein